MTWIIVGLYMAAAVATARGFDAANRHTSARPPVIVPVLMALTWPIWVLLALTVALFVRPR